MTCDRPPVGWTCTRQDANHDGPCAAVPTEALEPSTPHEFLIECVREAGQTYTVEGVIVLLNGENKRLGGRPVEMIGDGRGGEVLDYLRALTDGMVAS